MESRRLKSRLMGSPPDVFLQGSFPSGRGYPFTAENTEHAEIFVILRVLGSEHPLLAHAHVAWL